MKKTIILMLSILAFVLSGCSFDSKGKMEILSNAGYTVEVLKKSEINEMNEIYLNDIDFEYTIVSGFRAYKGEEETLRVVNVYVFSSKKEAKNWIEYVNENQTIIYKNYVVSRDKEAVIISDAESKELIS